MLPCGKMLSKQVVWESCLLGQKVQTTLSLCQANSKSVKIWPFCFLLLADKHCFQQCIDQICCLLVTALNPVCTPIKLRLQPNFPYSRNPCQLMQLGGLDGHWHPALSEIRAPWITFHLHPYISPLLAWLESESLNIPIPLPLAFFSLRSIKAAIPSP